MKVFMAGSTGAIGRALIPMLVSDGHNVVALVRNRTRARVVEAFGAEAAVGDPLNKHELTDAIAKAQPEVVINQLTALQNGINLKKFDESFTLTNRLRTEVTDTMLAAARHVGARRVLVQSYCGWPFAREGGPVKSEYDPLDPDPPASCRKTLDAIRYQEDAVCSSKDIEAIALRYGAFYGPGTSIADDGQVVDLLRRRKMPLVGDGAGVWSFIHIRDAARATVQALSHGNSGIYNVVDDEPARVSEWLPVLADAVGASPPRRIPVWLARLAIGDAGVSMMTQVRAGSNTRAKRELDWTPSFQSWRDGFHSGLKP